MVVYCRARCNWSRFGFCMCECKDVNMWPWVDVQSTIYHYNRPIISIIWWAFYIIIHYIWTTCSLWSHVDSWVIINLCKRNIGRFILTWVCRAPWYWWMLAFWKVLHVSIHDYLFITVAIQIHCRPCILPKFARIHISSAI